MVVVLPEPLTPATRTMKGRAVISSGFATGASTFSISRASSALSASGVISGSKRPSPKPVAMLLANSGPKSARISSCSSCLDRRLVEPALGEVLRRAAEQRGGLLEPALEALPPGFLRAVVHAAPVIAVSTNLGKQNDTGRDARPPALPRRADAGDRQAGGLCRASRAEGRREPGGSFRRPCASACRAIRRWRIGSTRTPPAAWCSAATARRSRCSASCSSRARSARPIGPWSRARPRPTKADRHAARQARREPRLVDEARSAWARRR